MCGGACACMGGRANVWGPQALDQGFWAHVHVFWALSPENVSHHWSIVYTCKCINYLDHYLLAFHPIQEAPKKSREVF